jgi:hypothetical protein
VRIIEETPACWRVLFDNPPLNVVDVTVFDGLARRLASFDRRPIAAAKDLIDHVSLPSVDRLLDGRNAFATALTWPETQQRIQALFKHKLQQAGDFENRFGAHLATVLDT